MQFSPAPLRRACMIDLHDSGCQQVKGFGSRQAWGSPEKPPYLKWSPKGLMLATAIPEVSVCSVLTASSARSAACWHMHGLSSVPQTDVNP
jgi:hypothetical protein